MTSSAMIQPLNLEYIFVNLFAGSPEIFMGLFFIGISILAGLFRMPNQIYLLMIALASILLYSLFPSGLYIIVLLIGGAIIFWSVSRLVKI